MVQDCIDADGTQWSFTIKPWANGHDNVLYVLDKTGDVTWLKEIVEDANACLLQQLYEGISIQKHAQYLTLTVLVEPSVCSSCYRLRPTTCVGNKCSCFVSSECTGAIVEQIFDS